MTREGDGDYESLITVTVETERQSRKVSGTVFADGRPRIVNIKGIRMDAEFGPSMIYITNLDKPGFIGSFSGTLGDAGINIATFHVGREAPGGNAIALIEIDGELPDEVLAKVRALPQVQAGQAVEVLGHGRLRLPAGDKFREPVAEAGIRPPKTLGAIERLCLASRSVHPLSKGAPAGRRPGCASTCRVSARTVLMANVVVVGSQWGDEGKGKIVDWLSEQADIVVRFQGGHNAGHTLVIDGIDLQTLAAALRRGARRQARR